MQNYKIKHFYHYKAVHDHFLKVGEARLYKLFEFALFGASTADHYEILGQWVSENEACYELGIMVISFRKGQ